MLYFVQCEQSKVELARTALVASGVEPNYMDVIEGLGRIVISTEDSKAQVLDRLHDKGLIQNYLCPSEMSQPNELEVNEKEGK